MTRRLFIVIGDEDQLATLPPDADAYSRDGWLVLRPELGRTEQLRVIAECLRNIRFWTPRPAIPAQRFTSFAPIEAFYAGKAVES